MVHSCRCARNGRIRSCLTRPLRDEISPGASGRPRAVASLARERGVWPSGAFTADLYRRQGRISSGASASSCTTGGVYAARPRSHTHSDWNQGQCMGSAKAHRFGAGRGRVVISDYDLTQCNRASGIPAGVIVCFRGTSLLSVKLFRSCGLLNRLGPDHVVSDGSVSSLHR